MDPVGMAELLEADPDGDRLRQHQLEPQTWNRYAYAKANPLRFIDPDGEEAVAAVSGSLALTELGATGGAAAGGTAAGVAAGAVVVGGLAAGYGVGTAINQIPGVSDGISDGLGWVLDNTVFMAENRRQRQRRVKGLLKIAEVHLAHIAGGPEKDPDFDHHKKEIENFLRQAKRVAQRLPKKLREKVLAKIEDIAHQAGVTL